MKKLATLSWQILIQVKTYGSTFFSFRKSNQKDLFSTTVELLFSTSKKWNCTRQSHTNTRDSIFKHGVLAFFRNESFSSPTITTRTFSLNSWSELKKGENCEQISCFVFPSDQVSPRSQSKGLVWHFPAI